MSVYEVWTMNGIVEVKADGIRRLSVDDKPTKIQFFIGDDIVAEFYPEHICGWAERKDTTEEVRKQLKDMEQRREMDRKK